MSQLKEFTLPEGLGKAPTSWTFLTNHSHVLLCLYRDPSLRLREVAALVGITERAVQRIVSDLEEYGAIQRVREGRRNHYLVDPKRTLRHPLESQRSVGDLLNLLAGTAK